MKYKVGDEVLVKAIITHIDKDGDFYIETKSKGSAYVDLSDIHDQKQFPREMWVWNDIIKQKQKAQVVFISDDPINAFPVVAVISNGMIYQYMNCAEIDSVTLSLDEAKQIIAEAKGVDVSEVNIEVK